MTQLVELASGVDSLYVSSDCDVPKALWADLDREREVAAENGGSVPFSLGGYDWQLKSRGLNRYSIWLDHPLVALGITRSQRLPTLYAQFRSEAIHSLGADGVVDWLNGALDNANLATEFMVSRIDLHADWQHWDLDGDRRHQFVCRSRTLTTYEDDIVLSGFSFGNRKSKTITARIYDKTREIEAKGNDWWFDLWSPAYEKDVQVLRTEFEFARPVLNEMRFSTVAAVLANCDRLWAYATQDWLTYREPSSHACPDRWPIAPEWLQIQKATLVGDALPMKRIRAGQTRGGLRRVIPALNGYMASFAALTGHDTIDDACWALAPYLDSYEVVSQRHFCDRVLEKRQQRL